MVFSIIGAIVSLAATAISAGVSNKQANNARNEARSLADRNRQDALKQQRTQNIQARRSTRLAEEQFNQSKQMDDISMNNQLKEAEQTRDIQNQTFLKQSAQKTLGAQPQEESFLYKRNLLSRIS